MKLENLIKHQIVYVQVHINIQSIMEDLKVMDDVLDIHDFKVYQN
jgi:hypothetical protein